MDQLFERPGDSSIGDEQQQLNLTNVKPNIYSTKKNQRNQSDAMNSDLGELVDKLNEYNV